MSCHPHIVEFKAAFLTPHYLALVTEYIEGETIEVCGGPVLHERWMGAGVQPQPSRAHLPVYYSYHNGFCGLLQLHLSSALLGVTSLIQCRPSSKRLAARS